MNILRKIFTILILLLGLSGCVGVDYYYNQVRDSLPEKPYEYEKYLKVRVIIAGETSKNDPVGTIQMNLYTKYFKTIEPLSDKVKIEANGKEYWVKNYYENREGFTYVAVYPFYDGVVDIVRDFTVYFGKIKLEDKNGNKKIIDMPPLKYERYKKVYTVFTTDPTDSDKYYYKTIYEKPLKDPEQKQQTTKTDKVNIEEVKN